MTRTYVRCSRSRSEKTPSSSPPPASTTARSPAASACPRCGERSRRIRYSAPDYAELLGLYLGDGHIARLARTDRLRISLDAKYVAIVDEAEALLRRVFPDNPVRRVE